MAGRPRTRARREAEAAQAGGKRRFDRAAKVAALARADEIGASAAAREAGVAVATLRTWRKRLGDEPEPVPVVAGGDASAARLRERAAKSRAAQFRAEDKADLLIGDSRASEARNAMVSASGFAERASELEAAAQRVELHEAALSEAQGRMVLELVGVIFADVNLPRPDALLAARLVGSPPLDVVEQARELVRRAIVAEVRSELLVAAEAERAARPALPAGEPVGVEPEPQDAEVVAEPVADGLPPFDSLPADWQQRWRLNPTLGRQEWVNEQRRQENARRRAAGGGGGRASRHVIGRHPGAM